MSEKHSEQPHTNYVKIWAILLVLLIISVLGPEIGIKAVTLITAFGIAIVKALMVAAYFMHLNVEKKIATYIILAAVAFLILCFYGIAPDVMNKEGTNWVKHAPAHIDNPVAEEGAHH